MTGPKTNELPGTRSVLRHFHMSASKARQVLDLIRGEEVAMAADILASTEREAAEVISKVLASAVANAVHNDGLAASDLYVASCYADEGTTMKRWRPRARGRATRIRKRTCHITVIVAELPEERLERRRATAAAAGESRSRRVAESRRRADLQGRLNRRQVAAAEAAEAEAAEAEALEAAAATESTETEVTAADEAVVAETTATTETEATTESTETDAVATEEEGK